MAAALRRFTALAGLLLLGGPCLPFVPGQRRLPGAHSRHRSPLRSWSFAGATRGSEAAARSRGCRALLEGVLVERLEAEREARRKEVAALDQAIAAAEAAAGTEARISGLERRLKSLEADRKRQDEEAAALRKEVELLRKNMLVKDEEVASLRKQVKRLFADARDLREEVGARMRQVELLRKKVKDKEVASAKKTSEDASRPQGKAEPLTRPVASAEQYPYGLRGRSLLPAINMLGAREVSFDQEKVGHGTREEVKDKEVAPLERQAKKTSEDASHPQGNAEPLTRPAASAARTVSFDLAGKNFSAWRKGQSWESPRFALMGLDGLCLKFFPKGSAKARKGHCSVYLAHASKKLQGNVRIIVNGLARRKKQKEHGKYGRGWHNFAPAATSYSMVHVEQLSR